MRFSSRLVAAPYQFPHLYPHAQDWLEFVEPKHVKVFVEIWDDGDVQQLFSITH